MKRRFTIKLEEVKKSYKEFEKKNGIGHIAFVNISFNDLGIIEDGLVKECFKYSEIFDIADNIKNRNNYHLCPNCGSSGDVSIQDGELDNCLECGSTYEV